MRRSYGTMNWGYYYDEAKKSGYNISVPTPTGTMWFGNVAYHAKKWLISQLLNSGFKKEDIAVEKTTRQ
jgi:hypothetical protein